MQSCISLGVGVDDADFILYVTAVDSPYCGVGTAAFAHHCETDIDTNRPLSGSINMCPGFFKESETIMQQIETVIHEILHALVWGNGRDCANPPHSQPGMFFPLLWTARFTQAT